jgi:hypothetical protein
MTGIRSEEELLKGFEGLDLVPGSKKHVVQLQLKQAQNVVNFLRSQMVGMKIPPLNS